ncbi:cytochrome P450 [Lindgomyces ingoldianus]|uniref:Cytochrome P450 n=1 Tax=Lindgomyces ingoldianus TaxID=673940 RepID=A0ACB6R3K7_9PLEO|nr:cytochrome P450 [Lindgomyces ingoldianus]KAF2473016.1 cytochrome P450 [Lindgomyces ingoldianus]
MSAVKTLLMVVGLYLAYWTVRAIYRIYFHPLSRYPGSKIAAASSAWYEWYWNFHRTGELLFEIERQHQRHGPVIRIGPEDLHVNDPEIFQDVTRVGSRFLKDAKFYNFITFPGTSIGETDPVAHRIRRQVLTPAFSPNRVQELAPFVKKQADKLMSRFKVFATSSTPVNFNAASKAFTMDVISKILFGQEVGCLDEKDFRNDFVRYIREAFEMGWTATAFPTLTKFSLSIPVWISKKIFPIPIMIFKEKCMDLVDSYLERRNNSSPESFPEDTMSVVIDMVIDPAAAKGHIVPTSDQLSEEIIMLLSAGNDTTSDALIIGIYQICRHPEVLGRLEDELTKAFPNIEDTDAINYENTKDLSFLNAVIKEILRISNPLPGRLPRVVPHDGYKMYEHHVPAGTALNFSIHLLNRHPDIWSNPTHFNPDRWLQPDSTKLDKHMATFYNGTRQCLGKHLAWCEMYIIIANLFRRFHLTIHDTTDADMAWVDLLLVHFQGKPFQLLLMQKES